MTLEELEKSAKHAALIRDFVNNDLFLDIKDAFVSHTPEAMKGEGDSDSKNFGKLIGTRYVLNTFQKIARTSPPRPSSVRSQSRGGTDPDLET